MEERKPDLLGTWFKGKDYVEFQMFIDKRKKRNNKYLILGELKHDNGIETFQGTIGRKFIKFVKLNDISVINDNGVPPIFFKGKWEKKYSSKLEKLKNSVGTLGMFMGVYLFADVWDPITKRQIDTLIEEFPEQSFEIRINNDLLKQDLINLGKN